MKIALIQLDIAWESKKKNHDKAEFFAKKAAEQDCDIVVFPEMFNTGFSMNVDSILEDEYGETNSFLADISKKYGIYVIAGFSIKKKNEKMGRNIASVYDRRGNRIAIYTKIHPFSLMKEDMHFLSGDSPVIFNIDNTQCSVFICYDLRFPEVFRKVAHDVQLIFVIANWPSSRKEHWESLLKARAIENQCFIVGVNRIGIDGNKIEYSGGSCIVDPYGNKIVSGGDKEEFLTGEINTYLVAEIRERFPFLKDMRL